MEESKITTLRTGDAPEVLRILETISAFTDFTADAIAGYCRSDRSTVEDVIRWYGWLFETRGGRHSAVPSWTVAKPQELRRQIDRLATWCRHQGVAGSGDDGGDRDGDGSGDGAPTHDGEERFRVAEAHITLAGSIVRKLADMQPGLRRHVGPTVTGYIDECSGLLRQALDAAPAPAPACDHTACQGHPIPSPEPAIDLTDPPLRLDAFQRARSHRPPGTTPTMVPGTTPTMVPATTPLTPPAATPVRSSPPHEDAAPAPAPTPSTDAPSTDAPPAGTRTPASPAGAGHAPGAA